MKCVDIQIEVGEGNKEIDGQYMFFLLSWWKIVEKGSEKKGERKGE